MPWIWRLKRTLFQLRKNVINCLELQHMLSTWIKFLILCICLFSCSFFQYNAIVNNLAVWSQRVFQIHLLSHPVKPFSVHWDSCAFLCLNRFQIKTLGDPTDLQELIHPSISKLYTTCTPLHIHLLNTLALFYTLGSIRNISSGLNPFCRFYPKISKENKRISL